MACSPVSHEVVIPVIGFTAFSPGFGSKAAFQPSDGPPDR
jgi:hypothetical protein